MRRLGPPHDSTHVIELVQVVGPVLARTDQTAARLHNLHPRFKSGPSFHFSFVCSALRDAWRILIGPSSPALKPRLSAG